MINLRMILMLMAVILLLLSAANVSSSRLNLLALGLALWALSILVPV